jgi:dienelactone hydrolase
MAPRLGELWAVACKFDRRFSYFTYVPYAYDSIENKLPLLVAVHGSDRFPETVRSQYRYFAEAYGCVVLAPYFPDGALQDDGQDEHYKYIEFKGVRFDNILLNMVDQVCQSYNKVDGNKFLLYGFSGGGQFSHRFAYIHPDRLLALGIGAPGTVTLADKGLPFPAGISDLESRFGVNFDQFKKANLHILAVVGENDIQSIAHLYNASRNIPKKHFTTRTEVMKRLLKSLDDWNISYQYKVISGAAHEDDRMVGSVYRFFGSVLEELNREVNSQ